MLCKPCIDLGALDRRLDESSGLVQNCRDGINVKQKVFVSTASQEMDESRGLSHQIVHLSLRTGFAIQADANRTWYESVGSTYSSIDIPNCSCVRPRGVNLAGASQCDN